MTLERNDGVIITQEKAIELLVYKTVKKVFEEERETMREEYKLRQEAQEGNCIARGMFDTDTKKEDFYRTKNIVIEHIKGHNKREALVKWIIGISSGSIAFNVIRIVWESIHKTQK